MLYSFIDITRKGETAATRDSACQEFFIQADSAVAKSSKGNQLWRRITLQLRDCTQWAKIATNDQIAIKLPGYCTQEQLGKLRYMANHTEHCMYNKNNHDIWQWADIQMSKASFVEKVAAIDIPNAENVLEQTKVKYRLSNCKGLKMCSNDHCDFVAGSNKQKNACKSHSTASLIPSELKFGACPATFALIRPVDSTDLRCWIGAFSATNADAAVDELGNLSLHNHPLPLYHSCNESLVFAAVIWHCLVLFTRKWPLQSATTLI